MTVIIIVLKLTQVGVSICKTVFPLSVLTSIQPIPFVDGAVYENLPSKAAHFVKFPIALVD